MGVVQSKESWVGRKEAWGDPSRVGKWPLSPKVLVTSIFAMQCPPVTSSLLCWVLDEGYLGAWSHFILQTSPGEGGQWFPQLRTLRLREGERADQGTGWWVMEAGAEPGTLSPETGSEPWGSADPWEKTAFTRLWLGIVQLINILIGFRHPRLLRAPVLNAGRQHGASG